MGGERGGEGVYHRWGCLLNTYSRSLLKVSTDNIVYEQLQIILYATQKSHPASTFVSTSSIILPSLATSHIQFATAILAAFFPFHTVPLT